ncbi:MAG: M1 family aminopeptidase [Bryobacteraceae bacterium]
MYRKFRALSGALAASVLLAIVPTSLAAQERRAGSPIDVQGYTVEAEITPNTQSLAAKAEVRFVPLVDNLTSASFELNNALNIARVVDGQGKQIPASRNSQDFSVRLAFDPPLAKGQPVSITFDYDGKLSGQEDSPVEGIRFAAIHPDYAFLLYPSRWFPVSGYSTDRFAADMRITVPAGYVALGSGLDSHQAAGDKMLYEFKFEHRSFPGSIAVVKDAPKRLQAEGVATSVYFRGADGDRAESYGNETSQIMSYFSGIFGPPPYADLTIVETEPGAPNGYAAPGLIFLAPAALTRPVASKLMANEVSRQWWEEMVSASTRNHLWLTNGLAAYSELLWVEHTSGKGAMESQAHDAMVESLTVDNVPIMQSARLEDYSPELWALTGSKGSAVANMLRYLIGDDQFFQVLKEYAQGRLWKTASTDDFRDVVERVTGKNLGYFFLQWIESSGAPEFKLEYTVYRTQKGFRVMGKISQDMDTFRMPVDLKIETEGNPEQKRIEVVGTSSEFAIDTFGKPKNVIIDPDNRVLRYSPALRVAVAIKKGEQFAELSQFPEALQQYQKALETNRTSSLAHYRIAEVYFIENNFQPAANEFREALNGDLQPKWTEVWAHISLGKIFDITGQRDRAVNEYNLAMRTKDDTQGAQEEASKFLKTSYERPRRVEQ